MTAIEPSERRTRVGIVGAGAITSENHLPVLMSLPSFDVAWLTDADEARLSQIASAYGVRPVGNSLADWPPADVILVAIPFGARTGLLESLKARVRGVYVEKPFAASLVEHDTLCARFPAAAIAVGYQRRSSTLMSVVRDVLAASTFGAPLSVRVEMGAPRVKAHTRYAGKRGLDSGYLMEVASHGVDASVFALGARDVGFEKVRVEREDGIDVHTEAKGWLEAESGDRVIFELLATQLQHTTQRTTVRFERATLWYDLFAGAGPFVELGVGARPIELRAPEPQRRTPAQLLAAHWSAFRESLESGRPGIASAENARITTRAVELLLRGVE